MTNHKSPVLEVSLHKEGDIISGNIKMGDDGPAVLEALAIIATEFAKALDKPVSPSTVLRDLAMYLDYAEAKPAKGIH